MEEIQTAGWAPTYSVVGREGEGLKILTSVVLQGEIMEFEVTNSLRRAIQALVQKETEES